jgi:TFIIF-interacting CTD phosphatase-like protein
MIVDNVRAVRPLLVFDLDETLVSSSDRGHWRYLPHDGRMTWTRGDGLEGCMYVSIRPYARQMLRTARYFYDVAVWTRGDQQYADYCAGLLGGEWAFVWARNRCVYKGMEPVFKPLKKIVDRSSWPWKKPDVLMIDDERISGQRNHGNLVVAPVWRASGDSAVDGADRWCIDLTTDLLRWRHCPDMRRRDRWSAVDGFE